MILTEKYINKVIKSVLNEMKGDNLHQFIEYILHYGKEGNLISNMSEDDVWNMLCEYELRLPYGAPILLTQINAVGKGCREIPIWKGNLIFQA